MASLNGVSQWRHFMALPISVKQSFFTQKAGPRSVKNRNLPFIVRFYPLSECSNDWKRVYAFVVLNLKGKVFLRHIFNSDHGQNTKINTLTSLLSLGTFERETAFRLEPFLICQRIQVQLKQKLFKKLPRPGGKPGIFFIFVLSSLSIAAPKTTRLLRPQLKQKMTKCGCWWTMTQSFIKIVSKIFASRICRRCRQRRTIFRFFCCLHSITRGEKLTVSII